MVISTVVVDFDVAGVVTSAAVVDVDVAVVSSGNTAVGGEGEL